MWASDLCNFLFTESFFFFFGGGGGLMVLFSAHLNNFVIQIHEIFVSFVIIDLILLKFDCITTKPHTFVLLLCRNNLSHEILLIN